METGNRKQKTGRQKLQEHTAEFAETGSTQALVLFFLPS
jgi:hypothetical protein